jgi:hypothetical protein
MTIFAALDRRSGLMHRMMERLGLDIEKTARVALGTQLSNVARSCAFCCHTRECRQWLDNGAAGETWRDFCPNAQRFERLRQL